MTTQLPIQPSHPIRRRVANSRRALVCGLTLLGAFNTPQIVRAQTPQSAPKLDAKVTLPAQFSAAQFYDALAKATGARIVALVPNSKQLAAMNLALGGRELSAGEIARQLNDIAEIRLGNLTGAGNLVMVRIPDEKLYPTGAVDETDKPFLDLLVSLSREQIDKMYLNGTLTPADLTVPQRSLYVTVRRTGDLSNFPITQNDQPLSDEQILAQPLRFCFSLQATMNFLDNQSLPSVPLFDYGAGVIWDALVPMDTKTLQVAADNRVATAAVAAQPVAAEAAPLEFAETQVTTLGKALDLIETATRQKLTFDARYEPKRLRARPVIISAGRYDSDELLQGIAASAGLQRNWRNNRVVLELRDPQKPMPQLPPQIETAQQKLRRLSPVSTTSWPFFSSRFSRKYAHLEDLADSERFFIRSRLLNENTEGYDKIDVSKGRVSFSDQLFFIGQSGGPNEPFITSSIQIH